MKLKKDKCCCGGTKKTPCVCMIEGNDCSASSPKCPCYALMDKQKKSIKKMVGTVLSASASGKIHERSEHSRTMADEPFDSAWVVLKNTAGDRVTKGMPPMKGQKANLNGTPVMAPPIQAHLERARLFSPYPPKATLPQQTTPTNNPFTLQQPMVGVLQQTRQGARLPQTVDSSTMDDRTDEDE